MLQDIRERAQGWVAWTIVILISITFAVFGLGGYLTGDSNPPVATVDGEEISERDLRRAVQIHRAQTQQLFGGRPLPAFLTPEVLRSQALDKLIAERVLTQAVIDSGFGVSEQLLFAYIADQDLFKKDGRFDRDLYEQRLRLQGYSKSLFEAETRASLRNRQLTTSVVATAFVTPWEAAEAKRLEAQERDIAWITVPAAKFNDSVELSEDEIQTAYKEQEQRFTIPEQVVLEYVELKATDLGKDIDVSDDELLELYEEQKSQFAADEERRARHILAQIAQDADEEAVQVAQAKIDEAMARLQQGEDFATVAQEMSDDPGSAELGGDLDYFPRGVMTPAFEESVFSLEAGQTSDVVRTDFGFHIILLEDIRAAGVKPFEQVRDQLLGEARLQKANDLFYDMADTMTNLAYEQQDSLDPVADELSLTIKTSAPVSRNGGGDLSDPKILAAAFSDAVLNEGQNSEAINLTDEHVIVVRVKERLPERLKSLEDVRSKLQAELQAQKATDAALAKAEELLAGVTSLDDLRRISEESGYAISTPGFATRDAAKLDRRVSNKAFAMNSPAAGDVNKTTMELSGDAALVLLLASRDGEMVEEATKNEQLLRSIAANELKGVMLDLESRADVERLETN